MRVTCLCTLHKLGVGPELGDGIPGIGWNLGMESSSAVLPVACFLYSGRASFSRKDQVFEAPPDGAVRFVVDQGITDLWTYIYSCHGISRRKNERKQRRN